MSYKLISWAKKQDLSPGRKSVLMNLCIRADNYGVCFPSQRRIAEDTGYSERTVRRHIKALEDAGLIERERRQKGYIRSSDSYMITAPIVKDVLCKKNNSDNQNDVSGADLDNVSYAEADNVSAANEYTDKKSYEFKDKYIKILSKRVFIGDRATENNPEWVIGDNFKVYKREYDALMSLFPEIADEQLMDIMSAHDLWLAGANERTRENWFIPLLSYLNKLSKENYGDKLNA